MANRLGEIIRGVREGEQRKGVPIFRRILIPMMLLVVAEIAILIGVMFFTHTTDSLSDYSRQIVSGKLDTRQSYLESTMINDWMNVSSTVNDVDAQMESHLADGSLTLEELNQPGGRVDNYLADISSTLVSLMRTSKVTGAYIVLNTNDLGSGTDASQLRDLPGVYLRDLDPMSAQSENDTDLLIERSPASVVERTGIATDKSWGSCFTFKTSNVAYYPFVYQPFQAALAQEKGSFESTDLGYWGSPQTMLDEDRSAITYSVPLMLNDGTVYGVLGVDLLVEYVNTLLPSNEISTYNTGSYFMAVMPQDSGDVELVTTTGSTQWMDSVLSKSGKLVLDSGSWYSATKPLGIYSTNVPYTNNHWVVGAVESETTIQKSARDVWFGLLVAALAVLAIGIVGSVYVAFRVQKPIRELEDDLRAVDSSGEITVRETGIAEVDELAGEIVNLNQTVIESGKRFSNIIRMASEDLGGFEVNEKTGLVYVSDGLYNVFGFHEPENAGRMTPAEFFELLEKMTSDAVEEEVSGEDQIYQVRRHGKKRYVRLRVTKEDDITFGLAEDVTNSILRNRMLVFERDHDRLTRLMNRGAFHKDMNALMESHNRGFAVGALLMMDLDNLKLVNDKFGHAYGDDYIKTAANVMTQSMTTRSIVSRISGDEFNVFTYGDTREELEERIDKLREAFQDVSIEVPGGERWSVRISAGVAWYPQDAQDYESLQRFADSALYVAKRSRKGNFETFDLNNYQGEDELRRKRDSLAVLLEQRMFHYAYQPIVAVRTGKVFAYEALLRPDHREFKSPIDLLNTARTEGKLNQIEDATVPTAINTFFSHCKAGRIPSNVKLFFNTISNQVLSKPNELELEKYGSELSRLVMEITEEETIDQDSWNTKVAWLLGRGGKIALDDYGAGYNSEKTLLRISPEYIKLDIAIIKNIQDNKDQQGIMEYIVNYAHERGKYVIAEGVETEAEAQECVKLGADLIQGYYLSRPQETPQGIPVELSRKLREMHSEFNWSM